MPGKHAPASPRSFYLSVARALGAALGAVGLMVAAVLVLVSRGGDEPNLPTVENARSTVTATSPSPTLSPSPSPTVRPTPSVLPVNQITVEVRNGTTRNGLGRSTATKISDEGYRIGFVGNQRPTVAESTLFYRPGRRAEALAFQKVFPEFTVVRESTALPQGTTLRVVIGGDYPPGT
jgi:hypothetical protein